MSKKNRRSGIAVMARLIGLIRPLLPVMAAAVLMGVLGYLCAIFLTILAGYGLIYGLLGLSAGTGADRAFRVASVVETGCGRRAY